MFSFKQIEAYQPSLPASVEPEPKPRVPDFKSRHLSDQQWQTWGEEVHNYLSDEQTITAMIIWKSNLRCSGQEGHFTSKRKKKKRLCLNWLLKELSKTWLDGMVGGEREWERMDLTAYSFSKKIVMAQLQWDHRLRHNTRVNSRWDQTRGSRMHVGPLQQVGLRVPYTWFCRKSNGLKTRGQSSSKYCPFDKYLEGKQAIIV